jgi:peptide chain release factor subunit 1
MLVPQEKFGFVVIGGRRFVIGVVCGDVQMIVEAFHVDLPTKHGMGGQSAVRFQRLADEARHNLVGCVAEAARRRFITNGQPNVTGIVLAGCAQLKHQLQASELLGGKLRPLVIGIIDVAYDGEQGFREAVERSSALLASVESVREQEAVKRLFDAAAKGRPCALGVKETMAAWEMGAISVVYMSRSLQIERVETNEGEIVYCKRDQVVDDVRHRMPLDIWIVDNFKAIG